VLDQLVQSRDAGACTVERDLAGKQPVQLDEPARGAHGLGFLGVLVYFIRTAESLLDGLWGVVLAIFWPAVLVYEALVRLGA
jgi:hypothetical protein